MINTFFFYLFSSVLLLAACVVVVARKVVHSIIALIITFVSAAVLFMLVYATFLGFALILVYVGAVVVFFLFTVMMVGEKADEGGEFSMVKTSAAVLFGGTFLTLLYLLISMKKTLSIGASGGSLEVLGLKNLGIMLYSFYALPLQLVGVILLVGVFGSLTLAFFPSRTSKHQNSFEQIHEASGQQLKKMNVPLRRGLRKKKGDV